MSSQLTFIIPVRHQANAKNWVSLKKNLTETIRSISRQDNPQWNAVIVANHGADLPQIPAQFEVKRVDFPPNPLHEKGSAELENFYDAFRMDKGRRVLAGMLHAKPKGHVMIVDDDDFVSAKLVSFVAENQNENGWYIKNGYIWSEGINVLYCYSDFSHFCGTSHIIRADLYAIPASSEEASQEYIHRLLGSHIFIQEHLDKCGTPLKELPFRGAIYRLGHAGAHSQSPNLLQHFFFQKEMLKRPKELCRRLLRLRPITPAIHEEFSLGKKTIA